MKIRSLLWMFITVAVVSSCRKTDAVVTPPVTTIDDKIKDTTLEYSRDIYLWNTQIPDNFDARSYDGPDEIMTAIRAYSNEPGFTEPVDHYSFAMKKVDWDNVSSGVSSSFGLNAFFFSDTDLRVRSVEEASPAGIAGIRRGWKLVKVAGSTDINTDNTDFLVQKIYESPSTAFTFEKPDGSTVDITLNAATFQEDPIYLDTIYAVGSKKAGYLVFNSFLGDTAEVISEFQQIFNRFATEGVTDVIVDVRYNGGGYVNLQEKLANFLVKPVVDGSIMMNQEFNDNYKVLNEVTKFKKLGSLDVNNLYFIVSDNTASASELLINNLKAYMNVKLVGPEPTYGKPVGFFPIDVGDWYIFPVSFRSTNGLGEGSYFDGLQVDNVADDGLDKDWGDKSESALASVLTHIGTGSFAAAPPSQGLNSTLEAERHNGNRKLNQKAFKGAVRVK